MGAFFKSFWGQLGRSTGKRVSNAIYGDKWATPYRVAVNKSNDKQDKRSRSHRGKRVGKNNRNRYTYSDYATRQSSPKKRSYKWLYWLGGYILFAGTYSAIINPNKDDVVLIIMLWVVVIIYLLYKNHRSRR